MSTHIGMWQRDVTSKRPGARLPLHRMPATPPAGTHHTRHVTPARVGVALGVLAVLGMVAYAVTRLAVGVQAVASVGIPGWVWPFAAGALLVGRISFRAGQYARGYGHARGIRRSHWASIQGKGH